jgi:hypothetical protein
VNCTPKFGAPKLEIAAVCAWFGGNDPPNFATPYKKGGLQVRDKGHEM